MVQEKVTPQIGILTGPTATGKTQIALDWAVEQGKIEIINADSLLVYQGLNIGTAKPSDEELGRVPHHLINILKPNEVFTAGDFVRAVHKAIADIHGRGKRALIVGGTGFYLKALLYGIWEAQPVGTDTTAFKEELSTLSNSDLHEALFQQDPTSAKRIGLTDRYRLIRALEIIHLTGKTPTEHQATLLSSPDPRFRLWIIDRDTEELHRRIKLRTEAMIQQGLIGEYQAISALYPKSRALQSVGYAQVQAYLNGNPPSGRKIQPGIPGLKDEIELATRQLVKRQRTWFKGQCPTAERFVLDKDKETLREAFFNIYFNS